MSAAQQGSTLFGLLVEPHMAIGVVLHYKRGCPVSQTVGVREPRKQRKRHRVTLVYIHQQEVCFRNDNKRKNLKLEQETTAITIQENEIVAPASPCAGIPQQHYGGGRRPVLPPTPALSDVGALCLLAHRVKVQVPQL
jgi:hypothetical protein